MNDSNGKKESAAHLCEDYASHMKPLLGVEADALIGKVVKTTCKADAGSGLSRDWMWVTVIGVESDGNMRGILDNAPACGDKSRDDLVKVNRRDIYEVIECESDPYKKLLEHCRPEIKRPLRRTG